MPSREPLLELDHATVVRGGVPILDAVSLSIERGDHTAILGPNGSGKSTLIKLLTCQLYPLARENGRSPVRILGRDRWNVSELRSRMGIISPDLHQRFVGGSSMGQVSGLDAVVAGFFASEVLFLHHEVDTTMQERAEAALRRVGAGALRSKKMNEMSTGEVRRVMIARALVHEPEVLVLDEPTTGLDLVARRDFLAQLRALAAEDTTLILITHHVEEIIPEIRQLVLLADGKIAAAGTKEMVLRPERLSPVFGSPVRLGRIGDRYEMRLDD